jgi:hypothetical protein
MPDFSRPGSEGALPEGVPDWREGLGSLMPRGLIYTGRQARDVVPCDRKYRVAACFKRKGAKGGPVDYTGIYRRARRLAGDRAAEMACGHGEPLRARILCHTWRSIPGGEFDFPMAGVIAELGCPRGDQAEGEPEPAADALLAPGGASPEAFSRPGGEPANEFYNEYDVAEGSSEPVSFSYGEHVESCTGIDYAPFVERAEKRARFHYKVLAGLSGAERPPFAILRREWWAVPDTLVVVVVYFPA